MTHYFMVEIGQKRYGMDDRKVFKWWLAQPKTYFKSYVYDLDMLCKVRFCFKVCRKGEEKFTYIDRHFCNRSWIEKL